jgi:hypothetical protein
MVKHTFFDKCNTILKDSKYNTGFNPVSELNTGTVISRILIHFDLSDLKKMIFEDGVKIEGLKHVIRMTNANSVNVPSYRKKIDGCDLKTRASSFDIIAFRIPLEWDGGCGFDYYGDYVKDTHRITSKDASNWFNARNEMEWDESGVFFNETLHDEYYNKYLLGEESVIITVQHFDTGSENLSMDVTDFINNIILNNDNFYGVGLAFAPIYESNTSDNKFVSFFTHRTNTFFHPYLETTSSDIILDNRSNFYLGNKNRLYFFAIDNGEYFNLDELPVCTIDNVEYQVIHGGKGVYYVEVFFDKNKIEPNTIMYDVWSNIKINGSLIDDIEMEFVILPFEDKVMLGKYSTSNLSIVPQLSGIGDRECIKIGDIREVCVDFIEEYSYGKKHIPQQAEYRLYVKEGKNEIDVYHYMQIERKFDEHTIIIDTNNLIPNEYYIDIKIKQGKSVKYYTKVLTFTLSNDVTIQKRLV